MTGFDNQAIKTRIKEIIEADKDLYDPKGVDGKIATVYIGFPKNKNINAISPTPYCVITNHVSLLKIDPYSQVVNNSWKSKKNFLKLLLIVVDRQDSGETVEKSLDGIMQKLINRLDCFVDLRKPSDGTDAKAKQSICTEVSAMSAGQYQGKATDGFAVTFEVLVLTG